jgi:hypothetical protein
MAPVRASGHDPLPEMEFQEEVAGDAFPHIGLEAEIQ